MLIDKKWGGGLHGLCYVRDIKKVEDYLDLLRIIVSNICYIFEQEKPL